jgi:hypothetical protein
MSSEIEELRNQNTILVTALNVICSSKLSAPPIRNCRKRDWWKSIAENCIRTAHNAITEIKLGPEIRESKCIVCRKFNKYN